MSTKERKTIAIKLIGFLILMLATALTAVWFGWKLIIVVMLFLAGNNLEQTKFEE